MSDEVRVALVNTCRSVTQSIPPFNSVRSLPCSSPMDTVDCHHLNVRFAHLIGVNLHESICEKRARTGEWLFLLAVSGESETGGVSADLQAGVRTGGASGKPIGYFEENGHPHQPPSILNLGATGRLIEGNTNWSVLPRRSTRTLRA